MRNGEASPAVLDQNLADLYARGAAAHPSIALTDVAFVRHLARCRAPVDVPPDKVHAEDLFLVAGALASDEAAMETLRLTQEPVITGYLRRIDSLGLVVDDIRQRLWEVLLVGERGAPPRLVTYSGRGQLEGFVGICAQRIALSNLRRTGAQKRALAALRAGTIAMGADPELAIIKDRYRAEVEQAVREAIRILDDRERLILRMLVVERLTVGRIAGVYGVNQSSVSRWLIKARQKVVDETRRLLSERLGLTESELKSLANLVMSQIDLSVSEVLGPAPASC